LGVPWRGHQEISQGISRPSGILDPGGSLGDIVGIPWGIPSRESLVGYPGGYLANLIYPKGALAIPWGTRPPIAPRVPRDHTRTLYERRDNIAHMSTQFAFSCIFPRIQRPPLSITDSVIALSARLRHTVTDRPLNPQCPCCFQSHRGAVVEKSPAVSYDRKSHRSIDAIHRCDWFGFPLPSASLGALALAKSAHRSATSRAARRKGVLMYDVARISPFGHNISQWCAGSLW
jgi:hypothetical protein